MRLIMIPLAAAYLALPAPVFAQDTIDPATTIEQDEKDGDSNPRLGLLGLLGLAGLLGLFRREPDIHVDARRDNPRS